MSSEAARLTIGDLLSARAHWCRPRDAYDTAEYICQLLGHDPTEPVNDEILDFLDPAEWEDTTDE